MIADSLSIPPHAEHYSVVLLKERDSSAFLLQKRAKGPNVLYAGKLGLYGGRREKGESSEECALREVAEESGIVLQARDLALIARLMSYDESGRLSYGQIYVVDTLTGEQVKTAFRHKCAEGSARLLKRGDIADRWSRLTSITSYSLAAYEDAERSRVRAGGDGLIHRMAAGIRNFGRTIF